MKSKVVNGKISATFLTLFCFIVIFGRDVLAQASLDGQREMSLPQLELETSQGSETLNKIDLKKVRDSVDPISTIGFFFSNPEGIGLTGEYEWREKIGERKSAVLNLGMKNKEGASGIYSIGFEYLIHNGDYDKSNAWLYEVFSLAIIDNRLHAILPLGARFGIKEYFTVYIELLPTAGDGNSFVGFGFGVRLKELLLPVSYF